MKHHLLAVILCGFVPNLSAQEDIQSGKPFLIHLGVNKVDSGAGSFTVLGEIGVPILRRGLHYVGLHAGGNGWQRGSYPANSLAPGDLLEKTAYWGGAYWGGPFWTMGAACEYGEKITYQVPVYETNWANSTSKNEFGANGMVSLHGKNGFGAFLRAGTFSGFGAGLSLNF